MQCRLEGYDDGPSVNMTPGEYQEWVKRFSQHHSLDFNDAQPLFKLIAILTSCIPGSVHLLLTLLEERVLNNFRHRLVEAGMELLLSLSLFHSLSHRHRGFIRYELIHM